MKIQSKKKKNWSQHQNLKVWNNSNFKFEAKQSRFLNPDHSSPIASSCWSKSAGNSAIGYSRNVFWYVTDLKMSE